MRIGLVHRLALVALGTLAGCARRNVCPYAPGAADRPYTEFTGSAAERLPFVPDLAAAQSLAAVEQSFARDPRDKNYRLLRADEVQCLAAANSSVAHLCELESQSIAAAAGCQQAAPCLTSLQQDVLAIRAVDERNRAAGAALNMYFQLAESEASDDLLDRSLTLVEHTASNLRQLQNEGLKVPVDPSAWVRQRIEMLDQRAQLRLGVRQLNEQLSVLLRLDPVVVTRIWPAADLGVTGDPINMEQAVLIGLETRADLCLIRVLHDRLDANTVPAARQGLQLSDAALGLPAPASFLLRRMLHGDTSACEADARRTQLTELLADREQAAAAEIRQAVYTVETRLQQIALARETLSSWRQRSDELRQRRAVGTATPFELSTADLEAVRAENNVLHQVVAWRIAIAKLKESQGLLAGECGFFAPCRHPGPILP